MRRFLPLALLVLLVGCAWLQRRVEPGPDGIMGTEDDIVVESKVEETAGTAAGVAGALGYGWIGLAIQGVAAAVAVAATGKKGTRPV